MIFVLTSIAALLVAFYIASPFLRDSAVRAPIGAPVRQKKRDLEAERENVLREIKDLEFDRRMGKVEPEAYTQARARLTSEAARVLRQIDLLDAPSERRARPTPKLKPNRARLEREIEIEVAVARARRARAGKAIEMWLCECGRAMKSEDRFCASCGRAHAHAQTETVAAQSASN